MVLVIKDIITLCGDNCYYCPRYNAETDIELEEVAKLWYKLGWAPKVLPNDKIKCSGCVSHKQCTYHLVECIKEKKVEKCNQCNEFPCQKISHMIERSEQYKEMCKVRCSDSEYELLSKAFFEKEINLKK